MGWPNKKKNEEKEGVQQPTWLRVFLREVVTMPRQHVIVFLIATVLLVLLEVELTEGWHLIHIIEVVGGIMCLYLIWAAWRSKKV